MTGSYSKIKRWRFFGTRCSSCLDRARSWRGRTQVLARPAVDHPAAWPRQLRRRRATTATRWRHFRSSTSPQHDVSVDNCTGWLTADARTAWIQAVKVITDVRERARELKQNYYRFAFSLTKTTKTELSKTYYWPQHSTLCSLTYRRRARMVQSYSPGCANVHCRQKHGSFGPNQSAALYH